MLEELTTTTHLTHFLDKQLETVLIFHFSIRITFYNNHISRAKGGGTDYRHAPGSLPF